MPKPEFRGPSEMAEIARISPPETAQILPWKSALKSEDFEKKTVGPQAGFCENGIKTAIPQNSVHFGFGKKSDFLKTRFLSVTQKAGVGLRNPTF